MDTVSTEQRSRMMSGVKGKNTGPELAVRRLVHRLGYRFRLHDSRLPGRPDIVLPRHRKIIQVHGCFWHQHHGCPRSKRPKTRKTFWDRKLDDNVCRDRRVKRELEEMGWSVLVLWQCEVEDTDTLLPKTTSFLENG